MTVRKVRPKQAFRPPLAFDHNAMALAADMYHHGPERPPERQQPVNPCTAMIRNSSGADRRQFECLELAVEPQLSKVTRENIWINGIEPTDTGIPFSVLLQPVTAGKWALGQVAGICPAWVDIQDVSHRWAYLPAGEYVLVSSGDGDVCIVQHPGLEGEQLCVVLLNACGSDLRGGCLAENHPGRGAPFDLYLGEWYPAINGWDYDTSATVKAIDWRYGVPYPDAGATGLFKARASDAYGTIWEVVALDCSSPGACEDYYT